MRVAVSRSDAAGERKGRLFDFHHTQEGELLTLPPLVCEGDQRYRDKCGCGRAFTGVTSGRACTTAVIEERPEAEVLAALHESPVVESWGSLGDGGDGPPIVSIFLDDLRALEAALGECAAGSRVRIRSTPGTFQIAEEVPAAQTTRRAGRRLAAEQIVPPGEGIKELRKMATAPTGSTTEQSNGGGDKSPTAEKFVYDAIRKAGEKFSELSDEQRERALHPPEGMRGKALATYVLDGKHAAEQVKDAQAATAAAKSAEASAKRSAAASGGKKASKYPDNIRAAVKRSNEIRGKEFGSGPKQHVHIRKVVTKELGEDKVTKAGIVKLSGASSLAQLMGLASGSEPREEMKRLLPLAQKMGDDPWCKGRHLAGALAAWTEEF